VQQIRCPVERLPFNNIIKEIEEDRMEDKEKRQEMAKKIAKSKVDFLRHLGTYVFVMIVLAVINNVPDAGGDQWWLWPAGIWGAFVMFNFLKVFIFKGGTMKRFEDQLTRKELEKMERED
jgi:hypothetical protein